MGNVNFTVVGVSGLNNSVEFKKNTFPGLSPNSYRIAQGFDSAAALVDDRGIRAAVAEERFTGERKTGAFPSHSIRYCLRAASIRPDQVSAVAHSFAYEPYRGFHDQDEFTRARFQQVYSQEAQLRQLEESLLGYEWSGKFTQVPHHLAHAASAFYPSGFEESLILVSDGAGEIESATVAVGRGSEIRIVRQISALHSLGMLYGVVTMYLGFEGGFDEFKVMGLAPFGDPRRYYANFMDFVHLHPDGTYTIPLLLSDKTLLEKETYSGTLERLTQTFGPPRAPESEILGHHMDIAAALQATLQTCLLHLLRHFMKETGERNLAMAGGVALNCTANGAIRRSRMFRQMFVQPAAGDDGSALGAALYVHRLQRREARNQRMGLPFWGPEFDDARIASAIAGSPECKSAGFERFDELASETAGRLADGEVGGWFQGRMEFGPRALGNRSILADPRVPDMRDRINKLVKKRETFRPFAPAVTAEAAGTFFLIDAADEPLARYMLLATRVRPEWRALLPAVTHVEGSARVQIVRREDHPRFWTLLDKFGQLTGVPVLLNTSFNVRGQPIVCSPEDSIATFLRAGLDFMVMGDRLVMRRQAATMREENDREY